jgi:hypothetical protein
MALEHFGFQLDNRRSVVHCSMSGFSARSWGWRDVNMSRVGVNRATRSDAGMQGDCRSPRNLAIAVESGALLRAMACGAMTGEKTRRHTV